MPSNANFAHPESDDVRRAYMHAAEYWPEGGASEDRFEAPGDRRLEEAEEIGAVAAEPASVLTF